MDFPLHSFLYRKGNMVVRSTNGGTTVSHNYALTANTPLQASLLTNSVDTFNIQFSVTGTITAMAVHEVIPQA